MTDFLPVQPLWVVVALVLLALGIAAIQTLHAYVAGLPLAQAAPQLAALDVAARGSFAACNSAAMLGVAAALALLVFGIRVHRVDDYRGRYRVWLWTTAALVWLSLDAATGIHDALGWGLSLLAGTPKSSASMTAAGTLTWVAVYALVFGAQGLRLAMEVWASKLSSTALIGAGILYALRGLRQLNIVAFPMLIASGLVESAVLMLAHLWLLSAVGLYARHVYLDATGRLKVHIDPDRKAKPRKSKLKLVKADKEARPATDTAKLNSPTRPTTSPSLAPAKPAVSITRSTLTAPDDDEDDEDASSDGLSKSERRRLKKLARREQRRAA